MSTGRLHTQGERGMREAGTPRIYYLHPLLAGPIGQWEAHLERAVGLGFDAVLTAPPFAAEDLFLPEDFHRLHPTLGWEGDAASGLGHLAGRCAAHGLRLLLDVVVDRVGRWPARHGPTCSRRPIPTRRSIRAATVARERWRARKPEARRWPRSGSR